MLRQDFKLGLIVCLVSFFLTGCNSTSSSILSVNEINKISGKSVKNTGRYEAIRLSNGAIFYKDRSSHETPVDSTISQNPDVEFGPKDISFDIDPFNSRSH